MSREKSSTAHFVYSYLHSSSSVTSQVERGESLNIALKREIGEELGAEVEVKGFFMHPFSFDYSEDEDKGYIKLFPMP